MNLLQSGYPKSGNLWLYRIVEGAMRRAGVPRSSFIAGHPFHAQAQGLELSFKGQEEIDVLDIDPRGCTLRIGFELRAPVSDLEGYLARATYVWTHSPLLPRALPVFQRFDPILYLIRDPRDVAISMSRFAFTPYMLRNDPSGEADASAYVNHRLDGIVRDWVRHVAGYLRQAEQLGIQFVFYERLLEDFDAEAGALLERLGCTLGAGDFESLREEVSFREMKEKDPGHVRKGKSGGWREVLTQAQVREVEALAGDMLQLLGYPSGTRTHDGVEVASRRPGLEAGLPSPGSVDRAERRAGRSALAKAGYLARFLLGPRPLREKIQAARRLLSKPGELFWKLK